MLVSRTTNIKEVGGVASMELDDIHGRHSQTCTIDHATNVAIKTYVVNSGLRGSDITRVFLRLFHEKEKNYKYLVSQLENLLLSELGVSIKVELGIHTADVLLVSWVLNDRKRVDFYLYHERAAMTHTMVESVSTKRLYNFSMLVTHSSRS